MYRVIIAGGRDFDNYELLEDVMNTILKDIDDEITIISGRAKGTDSLGETYARDNGYNLLCFPADWEKFGKPAGFIRNGIMAQNADALVAFWDGKSKGTEHMIKTANNYQLKVHVEYYNQ